MIFFILTLIFTFLFAVLKIFLVDYISEELYNYVMSSFAFAGLINTFGPSAIIKNAPNQYKIKENKQIPVNSFLIKVCISFFIIISCFLCFSDKSNIVLFILVLVISLLHDILSQFSLAINKISYQLIGDLLLLLFYISCFYYVGFFGVLQLLILIISLFILTRLKFKIVKPEIKLNKRVVSSFISSIGVYSIPIVLSFSNLDNANYYIASFYIFNLIASLNTVLVNKLLYSGQEKLISNFNLYVICFIEAVILFIAYYFFYKYSSRFFPSGFKGLIIGILFFTSRTFYSYSFVKYRLSDVSKSTVFVETFKVISQMILIIPIIIFEPELLMISIFIPIVFATIQYNKINEKNNSLFKTS
jgi:hypothetical protein